MRNIITEEKEMILRSRILIRPYWTERLVDKLLGEPDHVHYRKDGKPYASFWFMDKVVAAEKDPVFLKKKYRHTEKDAKRDQELDSVSQKVKTAIRSDVLAVKIPRKGTLQEIFDNCRSQLEEHSVLLAILGIKTFYQYELIYTNNRDPELNIWCQLYKRIGKVRRNLTFECGQMYVAKLYNINHKIADN